MSAQSGKADRRGADVGLVAKVEGLRAGAVAPRAMDSELFLRITL